MNASAHASATAIVNVGHHWVAAVKNPVAWIIGVIFVVALMGAGAGLVLALAILIMAVAFLMIASAILLRSPGAQPPTTGRVLAETRAAQDPFADPHGASAYLNVPAWQPYGDDSRITTDPRVLQGGSCQACRPVRPGNAIAAIQAPWGALLLVCAIHLTDTNQIVARSLPRGNQ